ncbi:unnamed protein product, partial [Iphiclides podalirius]
MSRVAPVVFDLVVNRSRFESGMKCDATGDPGRNAVVDVTGLADPRIPYEGGLGRCLAFVTAAECEPSRVTQQMFTINKRRAGRERLCWASPTLGTHKRSSRKFQRETFRRGFRATFRFDSRGRFTCIIRRTRAKPGRVAGVLQNKCTFLGERKKSQQARRGVVGGSQAPVERWTRPKTEAPPGSVALTETTNSTECKHDRLPPNS